LNLNSDFEHCFVDDDAKTSASADLLSVQVDRFRELNEMLSTPLIPDARLEQENVIQQLLQELDRQERKVSENRFEREFRGMK
jgi:hypothetical protein